MKRSFPEWTIYLSSKLTDHEYTQGRPLFDDGDMASGRIFIDDDLHLSVSVRSFRSENVAAFVKSMLDVDEPTATRLYETLIKTYPIYLTRDLSKAKEWLRSIARGSERYGVVASSGALRLKPYGFNVKASIEPKNWFLNDKNDIRSSYYMEDVASEFDIQGLELDWTCVAWDADLRFNGNDWILKSFRGTSWQDVNDADARYYLKNAYRVLLTRARQGMVIFIPHGDGIDPTRHPDFYDKTYEYLLSVGIRELARNEDGRH
ncbi:MAG TPA: DNA/RNA helicase domain-containing protein [Syntrophorhabdaceae bacterium]